jgi:hypothetical protein
MKFLLIAFLLISNLSYSQRKVNKSIPNKNTTLNKVKIQHEYAQILTLDDKIKYIDKLANLLISQNNISDIDLFIQSIINKDFYSKNQFLTLDQIEKLKQRKFPVPNKKEVLNIYFKKNNNIDFILFKSLVKYEEEDIHKEDVYYVGLDVSFVGNNNTLVYSYSLGAMANVDGIVDFKRGITTYDFLSVADGYSGETYYKDLNENKIKDKKSIDYLNKISYKYNSILETYWNMPPLPDKFYNLNTNLPM